MGLTRVGHVIRKEFLELRRDPRVAVLAEQVLPTSRLTEGMAFIQTGLAAGLAPGAAVAGIIIDAHGASPAYLVCAAGGVLALVGALLVRMPERDTNVPVHDELAPEQLA